MNERRAIDIINKKHRLNALRFTQAIVRSVPLRVPLCQNKNVRSLLLTAYERGLVSMAPSTLRAQKPSVPLK